MMMNRAYLRALIAAGALAATAMRSGEAAGPAAGGRGPVVRLGPCKTAPVIDGTITDSEWVDALVMEGSAASGTAILDPRRAWAYFTFDDKNLYFGIKSETHPGGRLFFWPHRPDVMTGRADGIEIWVAPLPSPNERPINNYQLWFDPGGAFWGQIQRYGVGAKFTGEVTHRSRIADDAWMFELAVPWTEVAVKPGDVRSGMQFMIRPTRNWRYPGNYASWGYPKAFKDYTSMVRVIVDDTAPVIKTAALGDLAHGDADVEVDIRNRSDAPQNYETVIELHETAGGEDRVLKEEKRAVSLAPGEQASVSLGHAFELPQAGEKRLVRRMTHYLATVVTRTDDGAVCYERTLNLGVPPARKWADLPSRNVKIVGGYYPYYGKVYARVDLGDLEQSEDVTRVVTRVRPEGTDKVLATGEIVSFEYNTGDTIMDVPDLDEGRYEIRAQVYVGEEPVTLDPEPKKTFIRHRLPWEHNTIGVTHKVYPPFTPLEVKDNEIACVLRRHRVNGLGLWDQASSMGTDLLAAPMRLECRTDGKTLEWTAADTPRFTATAGHQVVHEGRAECEAVSAQTRCTWDYDGMMKVELDIEPKTPEPVEELALVIPLKADEGRLVHATTFLRANPAMAVPPGSGVVWDSCGLVQNIGLGTFTPYIWVGGPERGIYWFADNDRGWIADDTTADFQLVRSGRSVELRVRFINAPAVVKGPRHIVFGLGATPVKPQPAGFRGWGRYPSPSRPVQYALASWRFTGLSNCESLDPLNGDWSVMDKLAETQRTGQVDKEWLQQWLEKHGEGGNKSLMVDLKNVFEKAKRAEIVLYTNPACESGPTPQARTFGREWRGDNGYIGVHITPSYVDYAVWCLDQMLSRGVRGGIYHDNTFPMASADLVSGNAYVRDDGRIQAGWDMFGHRELYKRMFVTAWERTGKWPLIAIHITNSHNASYFGFATISVDLELEYGTDRTFQEKFSFDYLNCGTHGKQEGLIPVILCYQGGGPKSTPQPADPPEVKAAKSAFNDYLERTRIGVCLLLDFQPLSSWTLFWNLYPGLHEIDYTGEDCRFLPYWSDQTPVESPDGAEVSVYRMRDCALAVVCGTADQDGTHVVKLDLAGLGLPPNAEILDFELDWGNRYKRIQDQREKAGLPAFIDPTSTFEVLGPGEVRLNLRRHDYRLLLIRPPSEA
jgi:hypothetical protein